MEGLLAALTFLPDEQGELRREIRRAADRAMRFLLSVQVREGTLAGAIPRAASLNGQAPNSRTRSVRIDYVQHALSAMMQYQALAFEK